MSDAPTQFRKRPVVIEAMRFDGTLEGHDAIERFVGEELGSSRTTTERCVIIATLEGDHLASPGDWIIRGVKGEFYPCKPDIFALTYEPVAPSVSVEDATSDEPAAWAVVDVEHGEQIYNVTESRREAEHRAEWLNGGAGRQFSIAPLYRRAPSSTERSPE